MKKISVIIIILFIGCNDNVTNPELTKEKILKTENVIFISSDRDGKATNIFMLSEEGALIKKITDYEWGEYVATAISPDSNQILFYQSYPGLDIESGMDIYVYRIKEDTILGPITQGHPGNFTPDGEKIVFSRHTFTEDGGFESVYLYNLNTNDETKLTEEGKTSFYPQISPSGKTICYQTASLKESPLYWQLKLMDIDGNFIKDLTKPEDFYWAGNGVFTPNGDEVIFHYNEQVWCYDICKISVESNEIDYITSTRYNGNWTYPDYWNPTISKSSNKVYFYSKDFDELNRVFITKICQSNLDGSNFNIIVEDNNWNSHPLPGIVSYYIEE